MNNSEETTRMQSDIEQRATELLKDLTADPDLRHLVDGALGIPKAFRGSGEIRLVILGQDPTVKNPRSRATIKTVLNLDRRGSLRNYLAQVCRGLGLDLDQHVYATNYLKNFFTKPPTQIKEVDVLQEFAPIWLPLLRAELATFPQAPVITLGQPLLAALVSEGASPLVRDYWGYTPRWKSGETGPFRYLEPGQNHLARVIFPFPHQPSVRKRFYKERLKDYTAFVKQGMYT
jgi:uracil-DNA glycosylase